MFRCTAHPSQVSQLKLHAPKPKLERVWAISLILGVEKKEKEKEKKKPKMEMRQLSSTQDNMEGDEYQRT